MRVLERLEQRNMKIGDNVKINKPDVMARGRKAVIEEWECEAGKWKVSFDESWCGWYREEELVLEK